MGLKVLMEKKFNGIKYERCLKPEDPYKLLYKYDLAAEDYHTFCIKASTRRQCVINIDVLYANRLPMIPQVKKYDLMSMCKSQIIPSAHYDFV